MKAELELTAQQIKLARRVYACLDRCASLENCAMLFLRKPDSKEAAALLRRARKKADKVRQDADAAMHELGIGYHQIYARPKPPASP